MSEPKSDIEIWSELNLDWQQVHDALLKCQVERDFQMVNHLLNGGATPPPTLATQTKIDELAFSEGIRRSAMNAFVRKRLI